MRGEDDQGQSLSLRLGGGVRFVDADATLDAFEAFLNSKAISVALGSPLEHIRLCLTEFLMLHRRELTLSAQADKRDDWLRMLGLVDFAAKVLKANSTRFNDRLLAHVRLLAGASVDPSQNAATDRDDEGNHKLFELLVGAAAATFADDLVIENPRGNSTTTPDLTVSLDGIRWGVPCKVLHSNSTSTYRDRVVEAIAQINRAEVDRGLVLINVKHLVPIDKLLPFARKSVSEPYEVHETEESASEHIDSFRKLMLSRLGDEVLDIAAAFRSSPRAAVTPHVAHYLPGMLLVRREGEPRMTPFVLLHLMDFGTTGRSDDSTTRFHELLNASLQWTGSSGVGGSAHG